MKAIQKTMRRVGIAGELLRFLAANKRWWITPSVTILLLLAGLILLAQSSAVSAFIYTLF